MVDQHFQMRYFRYLLNNMLFRTDPAEIETDYYRWRKLQPYSKRPEDLIPFQQIIAHDSMLLNSPGYTGGIT